MPLINKESENAPEVVARLQLNSADIGLKKTPNAWKVPHMIAIEQNEATAMKYP
jgi:hypothetical protein